MSAGLAMAVSGEQTMRNLYHTALLGAGLLIAASCSSGDVRLMPVDRDGLFHTSFAAAQAEARADGKLILLEFWRPG